MSLETRELSVAGCSIRLATENDEKRWNQYVKDHEQGSFFHRFEWQNVLGAALGHKSHYLVAENPTGELVGLMPLMEMRSLLFGHSLVSNPFATYGGALAHSPAVREALEERAASLAQSLGVGSLELRLRDPGTSGRPVKLLYECFYKDIDPEPEANLKAIRSKQRNIIRKGIKSGLVSREITVQDFYRVYSESVRNLGTPVFKRALFENILSVFPDNTECVGVYHEEHLLSAAMVFYQGGEICPYFWGGTLDARRYSANDFLAWELINRGASRGCSRFDFGRSKKDTGAYQWKANLGFEPRQLYYEYVLVSDKQVPEVNPNNPKYRMLIAVWKKLPLPMSQILGGAISASLG